MSAPDPFPPAPPGLWWRTLWRLVVIAAFVLAIVQLSGWIMEQTKSADGLSMAGFGVIALILLAYAALIAVPFVPGVEIGVGLMLVLGAPIAPFVYLATVMGLMAAFVAGKVLPYATLHRLLIDLRLRAACRLLERIEALTPAARLALLHNTLPRWLAPLATRYRYVTLGMLINLPGNSLLGGGGGLSLLAGLSRLYSVPVVALTFALATAPVPLLVWLTGSPLTWFTG